MSEKRQFLKMGLALMIPAAISNRVLADGTSTSELSLQKMLAVLLSRITALETDTIGSVSAYAGINIPKGWLLCDGRELPKESFRALYASLGDLYAKQINPTTGKAYPAPADGNFRIPDYRGTFLRSAGTSSLGQNTVLGGWQEDATNKNSLSTVNNPVTSGNESNDHVHSDAGHKHMIGDENGNGSFGWSGGLAGGSYYFQGQGATAKQPLQTTMGYANIGGQSAHHTHKVTSDVSLNSGDTETRPQNVGVQYMIKAK